MSTIGTARNACAGSGAFLYQRHRPEKTLLYQLVSKHYPVFRQQLAEEGRMLPGYVQREFEDYLKWGGLNTASYGYGARTATRNAWSHLVAIGVDSCPSCGTRRMAESAALLVDEVFPHQPVRQLTPKMACSRAMQEQLPRVLSFPFLSGCGPYVFASPAVQRSPVRCSG